MNPANLSEEELHAIAHAQYQCRLSSPESPDVSFDYELVKTLLKVICRLVGEVSQPSFRDIKQEIKNGASV